MVKPLRDWFSVCKLDNHLIQAFDINKSLNHPKVQMDDLEPMISLIEELCLFGLILADSIDPKISLDDPGDIKSALH